jgi:hypothetical protein
MSNIEIGHLQAVLRRTAAERCRLAATWPLNPSISAQIEANAVLDHETRQRLAQLQQKGN